MSVTRLCRISVFSSAAAAAAGAGAGQPSLRSIANAMLTVVRYAVIRSFSTTALIEMTSAPLMPRNVLDAS